MRWFQKTQIYADNIGVPAWSNYSVIFQMGGGSQVCHFQSSDECPNIPGLMPSNPE